MCVAVSIIDLLNVIAQLTIKSITIHNRMEYSCLIIFLCYSNLLQDVFVVNLFYVGMARSLILSCHRLLKIMMMLNIDCIFASLLNLATHLKWLIGTDSNKCLLVIKCSLISHFMLLSRSGRK